jgi:sulfotransferase family protein
MVAVAMVRANGNPARSVLRRWVAHRRRSLRRLQQGGKRRPQGTDGGLDQPPPPPACPQGGRTGPPDFVGVGVQRCGTTRWFDLIASHPETVQPNAAKELHFFDRFHAGGFTQADVDRYHHYFPRTEGRRAGEWTPLYMTAPWIPRLLAAAAPQARLLVILRDPVERYLSALELNTRVANRRGAPLSRYALTDAYMRGFYYLQLVNLLNWFDRSQVLILQYERCSREPETELRRTYEFLGLGDTSFLPDLDRHPKQQPEKPTLDADDRDAFAKAYREDVLRLTEAFSEIDLRFWPNFSHLAGRRPGTSDQS